MDLRLLRFDPTHLPPVDDLLVLVPQLTGATADSPWEGPLLGLDLEWETALRTLATRQRFRAKAGQSLVLPTLGRLPAGRIVLVGAGAKPSPSDLRVAAGRALRLALAAQSTRIAFRAVPPLIPSDDLNGLRAVAEGLLLAHYRFDRYVTKAADSDPAPVMTEASLLMPEDVTPSQRAAVQTSTIAARAVARARDLVNQPPSRLTPSLFAETIQAWGDSLSALRIEVLDRAACERAGMGLFLAVARGSDEEPRFIHLHYKPVTATTKTATTRTVALVGKGVTFDSGGLSLKTNEGMQDMKSDMAGAAAVLAATLAAAELALPIEIHAVAACTENMPSGKAYRIGDVIASMAGKTVEINNTDAEGRLTLADALTYVLKQNPDLVIDLATLTGACVVALGPHTAGVIGNDDGLAERWIAAATSAGEDMWRLPLPARLKEQLRSEVADMRNTGERWGGALTAGHFLQSFVEDKPWVHVDIAGPAFANKEHGHLSKGGTGFGVATLLAFLEEECRSASSQ